MSDLSTVFSTSDFIPHGHCYLWQPTLVRLHLVSDTLIALAYYSISVSLVYFAKRRADLPFKGVFWLFGAFIVACGTTHLLDVWTLWHPTYWVSGVVKLLTALLSVATAGTLVRLLPAALQLPSQAQLEAANARLQAEIAKQDRTEAVLRDAQRIARLGNWEYDLQTQIMTWSEELFRLFGLAPALVPPLYEEEFQRLAPASRVQLDQAVQAATRDGTPYTLELQYPCVDGSLGWFQAHGQAIRDDTGVVVQLVGTLQEISDRKHAELENQRLQARLQFVLSSSPAVLFTAQAEGDYAATFISDNCETVLGYTPTEFVSEPSFWASRVHPDDALRVFTGLNTLFEQGQHTHEYRFRYQDGSDHWVRNGLQLIRDAQGTPLEIVGYLVDISDRKQAEQQLELQSIVTRNIAEGVCLTRAADGVIVYANPKFERLFGYPAGALVGRHVSVVNYEDVQTHTQAVYERLINQIAETGEATYEVHNVKQDGTPFWCQATTSMFEHPEYGTVFVVVQQDMTERKQAEHTIRASLKEKEVLLQEIHHRVKNNLQIVYSLLRLQRRQLKDPQAAAVLLESQNRIEAIALVHEKLYRAGDLAHIDASEYIPNLVVNLVSTYGLHAHQVQLELAIEPLPLSMDCAVPCGLMINELVSNAFKYAFPDERPGRLTVSLQADTTDTPTPYVTLTVADNGIGLPDHVSLSNATTLGLQLVSDFVAQLQGTLQLDSTNGTSVQVRFPQTTLRQAPVTC